VGFGSRRGVVWVWGGGVAGAPQSTIVRLLSDHSSLRYSHKHILSVGVAADGNIYSRRQHSGGSSQ
jgi:hypothetical protein